MIDCAVMLSELARVKATFQLRAIAMHMGAPLPAVGTQDADRHLTGAGDHRPAGLSSALIHSTHDEAYSS